MQIYNIFIYESKIDATTASRINQEKIIFGRTFPATVWHHKEKQKIEESSIIDKSWEGDIDGLLVGR